MCHHSSNGCDESHREVRLNGVLADLIRCRAAGGQIRDEDVINEHPELMPDLAEKLHALRLVEEAEKRARGIAPLPRARGRRGMPGPR